MSVEWNRYWCRVLFKEFIKHYRKLTDEQIVADVRQSMDDLEDLVADTDTFGSQMVRWSLERADEPFATAARENGKKGGRPRKDTTADGDTREGSQGTRTAAAITRNEPLENDPLDSSATISAVAPTREDGELKSDSGNAGNLESATTATIYGVATHREAGDVSATDSKNMRQVPHNEAPAHGFSGGRTAQGTMSRSPEAAAQSGKAYDQETDQVSTNGPRQAEDRQSRRTEGHSLRVGNIARPSVRSPGRNSRCPNSREEFHAFVADNNLHEALAEEWYAIHEARGWVDENGNPIKNWRGALKNFCIKVEQKRRTA